MILNPQYAEVNVFNVYISYCSNGWEVFPSRKYVGRID